MTDIRNDSLVNYSTSRKSFPSCLLSEPRRPSLSSREEALYYGGEEEVKASSISDTLCVCSSQAYSLGKSGPKQSIPMMSSSSRKANARSLLQLSPIASEIFLLFLLRIASQKKKKLRYRKRCLVLFLLFLQL